MKSPASRLKRSIEPRILVLRGARVILDAQLAELYGVDTKHLNQAVKRNPARFPADFAFQLTAAEVAILRSQILSTRSAHGGRRYAPWAFTEHGVIMAASVLNSGKAIEMSVFVVRAFVRLRELTGAHAALAATLAELESQIGFSGSSAAVVVSTRRRAVASTVSRRRE